MRRLISRPLIPVALLLAVLVLTLAWYREHATSHRKAQEIWLEHEQVIDDAAMKKGGSLSKYQDACLFFQRLAGIIVPGDYSTYLGARLPNEDTATALEPLRHWYAENKDRLYWDEEHGEVRLAPE